MASNTSPFDKTYDSTENSTGDIPQNIQRDAGTKRPDARSDYRVVSVSTGTETAGDIPQSAQKEAGTKRADVTEGSSTSVVVPAISKYGTGKPKRVRVLGNIIHD